MDDQEKVFEQLLNPNFPIGELSWDIKVQAISKLIDSREIYQKVLGRLAASLPDDKRGRGSAGNVKKLAHDIEEHTGRKISPYTIYKYRQVCKTLESLWAHIPADFSFNAWIALSQQEDPAHWLARAQAEGLSDRQMVREIRLANPPQKRPHTCRKCGAKFPAPICPVCLQSIDHAKDQTQQR